MNNKSSPEIHMKSYNENINELMQYLVHITNSSLEEGTVPNILIIAAVVTIRKIPKMQISLGQ